MLMSRRNMSEHEEHTSRLHRLAWYSQASMGEASRPEDDPSRREPRPAPSLARRASERPTETFVEPSSSKRKRPYSSAEDRPSIFRRPSEHRPSSSSSTKQSYSTAPTSPASANPTRFTSPISSAPIRLPSFSALTSGVPPYQSSRRVSSESEGGASSHGRFAYGGRRSSSPRSPASNHSRRASGPLASSEIAPSGSNIARDTAK